MKKILLFLFIFLSVFLNAVEPCSCDGYWKEEGTVPVNTYACNTVAGASSYTDGGESVPSCIALEPSFTCSGSIQYRYIVVDEDSEVYVKDENGAYSTVPSIYRTKLKYTDVCTVCTDLDIPFPLDDSFYSYPFTWEVNSFNASDKVSECSNLGGILETALLNCVETARCKVSIPCVGIIIDDVCTDCPPNSSPNADNSACPCDQGFMPEGNSCVSDRDGDGYKDEDDVFPDDETEWADNDRDSLGDNKDTDDDNDNYSDVQEIREGTDPKNSNDNGGTDGSNTSPDGGGDNSGNNTPSPTSPPTPENNDCDGGCGEVTEVCWDEENVFGQWTKTINWVDCEACESLESQYTGRCEVFDSDPTSCNNPPSMYGLAFQSMGTDYYDCENKAAGATLATFICPDKTEACYFNSFIPSDEGNASIDPPDYNEMDGDTTSSGIEHRLEIINETISNKIDTTNSKIDVTNQSIITLGDLIKDNGMSNHDDLIAIDSSLSVINTNMVDKLIAIDSGISSSTINLGNKLDAIRLSVNNVAENGGDSTEAINGVGNSLGDKLDGIMDAIEGLGDNNGSSEYNPDLDTDTEDLDEGFENSKSVFSNALISFETTGADLRALANGLTPPTITASGSCLLSDSTSFGSFNMDFSILETLRVPFQFFLNIFLVILTLKLYSRIARDIVSYFIGGN